MKLKDLLKVTHSSHIELHSGFDGKLIAKSPKTLEKYGEVEVLSIYPKMKLNDDGSYVTPYIYVYGSNRDIVNRRLQGDI